MPQGVVVQIDGPEAQVAGPEGRLRCTLPGKWRLGAAECTHPIAVGDEVVFRATDEETGVLEKVLPRRTKLSRPASGGRALEQVVVANLDQVLIVVAAAQPKPKLRFIDRVLVGALRGGLDAAICVNKMDLARDGKTRATFGVYEELGLPLVLTSVENGRGIDELRALLQGKKTVFAGPSGVGKSSLLNAMHPGARLTTGEVSEKTSKGKHVTTRVSLIALDDRTFVADTPGLRAFGIWGAEPLEVQEAFPEIIDSAGGCRYRDCLHRDEPSCAVKEALGAGRIRKVRYDSYLRILDSLAEA